MPRMKDRYTIDEAEQMLAETNSVSPEFRIIISKTLTKLPKEIVDWTIKNTLFVSSSSEYLAFWGRLDDWKDKKGFIFLSQYLKHEEEETFSLIIAQEIAHAKLDHKSPLFTKMTRETERKQEQQAEELAKKWLNGH